MSLREQSLAAITLHSSLSRSQHKVSKTGAVSGGATPQNSPIPTSKTRNRKEEKRLQTERRLAKSKLLKPLKLTLEKTEADVADLESQCEALEQIQLNPDHYNQPNEVVRVAQEIKHLKIRLEQAYQCWEEAELALEEAETEFELSNKP